MTDYARKPWILVDIDGTLTEGTKRAEKYLRKENPDWDGYFNACGEDEPIQPIITLVETLAEKFEIVLCTGRRQSCDKATREWLKKNTRLPEDLAIIYRKDGDTRHDVEVKPERLAEFIEKSGKDVLPFAIFEDRNSMVAKWRSMGFTCLQVAEGDF